ncbi:MAG TPA: hypothetical protein PLS24_04315, partial [Sedimentisphaerales bacterium]|nr:hypothetical protein [Sedimentisphaerales bacterium]
RIALSHGVDRVEKAHFGVSSITAWLAQASDKALPDRARRGPRDSLVRGSTICCLALLDRWIANGRFLCVYPVV